MRGRSIVRAEKGIILIISNEDMDDVIRIIKSLENWGVLSYGVGDAVKHEIKKQRDRFLGMLSGTLGAPKLVNMLTEEGVIRAGKGVVREGREYNDMNYMDKSF